MCVLTYTSNSFITYPFKKTAYGLWQKVWGMSLLQLEVKQIGMHI